MTGSGESLSVITRPLLWNLVFLLCLFCSGFVSAKEQLHHFDIKPQPLGLALTAFSKITDYQFIYTDSDIASIETQGVTGNLSVDAGLQRLLKDTVVRFKYTNENTILLLIDSVSAHSQPTGQPGGDSKKISDSVELASAAGNNEISEADEQQQAVRTKHREQSDAEVEEIVVTALKRASSLQDAPIAISALTGKELERIGADDFLDFIGSVPGLSVRDNGPGQTQPIIRGIFSPGEPQVGVYFDEAIVTGAPGTTNSAGRFSPELKPFDIERIEILKGPQGSLYGGGSMGGTLRFITNKPDATKFAGSFSIEGSSVRHGDAGYQLNAMLNFPLIENKLALRVVAYKRQDPGFVDNVVLGRDDINDIDTEGGRIAIRWTPAEDFTASATVFYQNQKVGGGFHFNPDLDADNPLTNVGSNEPFDDEYVLYNITLEKSLDWLDALYSFTYYDRNAVHRFHNGFTGVPFPPLLSVQPQPARSQSHEFRLTSTGDNLLDWTVGVFYQDRKAFADSRVTEPTAQGNEPDPVVFFFRRTVESSLIQRAVFGELNWHVSERLDLTAGVRYFDIDSGSDVSNIFAVFTNPVLPQRTNITRGKDDGPIFKLHAAYHLSDDILLYAQFSQGFRPGGANQNSSTIAISDPLNAGVPESFKSDSVDSYEFGFHTAWFANKVIINGALFHMDWSDIVLEQRSPTGLFAFLNNADSADVDGLELEAVVEPNQNLRFTAALTYLNARLTSNGAVNRQVDGGQIFSRSGLDGDNIPNVPEWNVNFSLDYSQPLPWRDWQAVLYLSLNYVGESFSDFNEFLLDPASLAITNTPNVAYNSQGDYTLVDLRIGVESDNDWGAFLFIENVFDERGITHVFEDSPFRPAPGLNFIERPRTVGVVLNKSF